MLTSFWQMSTLLWLVRTVGNIGDETRQRRKIWKKRYVVCLGCSNDFSLHMRERRFDIRNIRWLFRKIKGERASALLYHTSWCATLFSFSHLMHVWMDNGFTICFLKCRVFLYLALKINPFLECAYVSDFFCCIAMIFFETYLFVFLHFVLWYLVLSIPDS